MMLDLIRTFIGSIEWDILAYFVTLNSFYLVLLVCAAVQMRRYHLLGWRESRWRILGSRVAPKITIVAPAYNEALTIVDSVQSLLSLHYPNLEVVVVNDGSTDDTLPVLAREFELVMIHPIYSNRIPTRPVRALYRSRQHANLVVADKENGGTKSDPINAGLNLATGDLVCVIDADTLIEPDAMQRMVRPFLFDDRVVAAGGTIRIVNGSVVRRGLVVEPRCPRNYLAGVQTAEYLRAFLFGRLGFNALGGNLIISGAFGLFRTEALIESGGFAVDVVGEDMELVVRLLRAGHEREQPQKVEFIPDPVAWTEGPQDLRSLRNQRERWHRGLTQVLRRHGKVLFNPRYGWTGMVSYPVYLFFEWLAAPMEILGLFALVLALLIGAVDFHFALLFLAGAYGFAIVVSAFTLYLEETSFHRYEQLSDRARLLMWAMLEHFGYRQLTAFWRLEGIARALRRQSDWAQVRRRGFADPKATAVHAE